MSLSANEVRHASGAEPEVLCELGLRGAIGVSLPDNRDNSRPEFPPAAFATAHMRQLDMLPDFVSYNVTDVLLTEAKCLGETGLSFPSLMPPTDFPHLLGSETTPTSAFAFHCTDRHNRSARRDSKLASYESAGVGNADPEPLRQLVKGVPLSVLHAECRHVGVRQGFLQPDVRRDDWATSVLPRPTLQETLHGLIIQAILPRQRLHRMARLVESPNLFRLGQCEFAIRVGLATLGNLVPRVVCMSSQRQMIWAYAPTIVATVHDHQARRDRPLRQCVGNAVGVVRLVPPAVRPVSSGSGNSTRPEPASIAFLDAPPKCSGIDRVHDRYGDTFARRSQADFIVPTARVRVRPRVKPYWRGGDAHAPQR